MKLTIDQQSVECPDGTTVLEAAAQAGIYIPSLCYHPDLPPLSTCRLCVVSVEGRRGLLTACSTTAEEGMVVHTATPELLEHRRSLMWLMESEMPAGADHHDSQFQQLVDYLKGDPLLPDVQPGSHSPPVDEDEPLYRRDMNLCILCGRCVTICQKQRGVGVIGFVNRGIDTFIGTPFATSTRDAGCKFCGACIEVCPTGALQDREEFDRTYVPCQGACPAHVDISRYVRLTGEGRFDEALAVIRETVPFPHTLGCVCDHPCETACHRGDVNSPVSVREIKRFVAERDTGAWKAHLHVAPDTGKRVAVIGSGPAGLTAAWFLRIKGHAVTVFEALPVTGGMLRVGIPRYRLPAEILDREIAEIQSIGIDLVTNRRIEDIDQLFEQEGFDAVFVGLGAHGAMSLGVPGEDDPRVLNAVTLLRDVGVGQELTLTGTVGVVGGGNVAIDAARTALRMGADKVQVLYRRTRAEMPAEPHEIADAETEGVEMCFLTAPVEVQPDSDGLSLVCDRMELGEPDDSGRRRPQPIPDSRHDMRLDWLIAAIGQQSDVPESYQVEVTPRGRIAPAEQPGATSREGVFTGGDVLTGPASVVTAIESGRLAAAELDRYLGGDGDIRQQYADPDETAPYLGHESGFSERSRETNATLPVAQRLCGFDQVEQVLDQDEVQQEATRCLRCQLRLKIRPAPLPPV